jgi:uncharacterized protein YbjQ (UPF0145 family)
LGPTSSGTCSRGCATSWEALGSYEKELRRAREIAFQELEEAAAAAGQTLSWAWTSTTRFLGEKNGMLMVSVSGTAVRLD